MVIDYILGLFIFIFGLCIGSFLNCIIYRLEEEKNIGGRSFCPRCKHALSWLDLLPIFSFIFLGGKCRYCKKGISIQYPLVELATGIIFLLIFSLFAPNYIEILFLFYIASTLVIIFIYDLKHYIIPDKVLFPAIIITIIYKLLENFRVMPWLILAVVIASGFFFTIFILSRGRAMGFGDVKLAVLMGFLLGLPNVLVALFLAFFFGAIIGLILMALQKKGLKSEIPFGPFLIIGTFIALFYGSQLVSLYMSLFLF